MNSKKKISLDIDSIITRLLEVCGQKPGKQVQLAEDEVMFGNIYLDIDDSLSQLGFVAYLLPNPLHLICVGLILLLLLHFIYSGFSYSINNQFQKHSCFKIYQIESSCR